MEKYKIRGTIAGGSYGHVYKACNCENQEMVALKEISPLNSHEGVPSSVIREISFLKEMDHSNIVRLLDVVNVEKKIYLVLEHMDFDLKAFMVAHPKIAKNPHVIKMFLHQLLSGLAYCHSHKILHRDLKPQNLLIGCSTSIQELEDIESARAVDVTCSTCILKLADFGSARAVGVRCKTYTEAGKIVTLRYTAPELLLGERNYSTEVDMWSVGCIFAEMVIQQRLLNGPAPTNNFLVIQILSILGKPNEQTWPGVTAICDSLHTYVKNLPPSAADQVPGLNTFDKEPPKNLAVVVPGLEAAGIDLLSKLLCLNPKGRIEAAEALNHPYFQDIERP